MSMNTAYGYLRVSGRDQIDGDGFPRQAEAIDRWAASSGCNILAMYTEKGVTGGSGIYESAIDRPAFSDLMEAILGNGCRTIVVECLDRLARELMIQTHLIVYLRSKNISLISAMTGEDVTAFDGKSDPMRWAMVQMQGVFAELERNMTVRKLKASRDRKRIKTGHCEGPMPFGLCPKRPNERPCLDEIFQRRANGNTFPEIAEFLNILKYKRRNGGKWDEYTVRRAYRKAKRIFDASRISDAR